jgi:hypothetical protein
MTVSVIPSPILCLRPLQDATTRIEVIIFSIAIYLDRGSQAQVMTEDERGVAWKSWNPRRNRIGQEFQ